MGTKGAPATGLDRVRASLAQPSVAGVLYLLAQSSLTNAESRTEFVLGCH